MSERTYVRSDVMAALGRLEAAVARLGDAAEHDQSAAFAYWVQEARRRLASVEGLAELATLQGQIFMGGGFVDDGKHGIPSLNG